MPDESPVQIRPAPLLTRGSRRFRSAAYGWESPEGAPSQWVQDSLAPTDRPNSEPEEKIPEMLQV
jgi:hypothetical protein